MDRHKSIKHSFIITFIFDHYRLCVSVAAIGQHRSTLHRTEIIRREKSTKNGQRQFIQNPTELKKVQHPSAKNDY